MSDANVIEIFELDVPRCAKTYGESPCAASVGVTGDFKCYNCPGTCQDPSNYIADTPLTLRFAVGTEDLPPSLRAFACIKSISIRPQEIMPAESLGIREEGKISFFNFRDNDVLFDNYVADRSFNPYNQGTFWRKFVARYPNIQGYPCRYLWGEVGTDLADFETRHYYAENKTGPGIDGDFEIEFKDALKFLDGKKAVAPVPNTGVLASSLAAGASTCTLSPTGVGDLEYGNGGIISIGDEKISYTRNTGSETLTLTARGLSGTEDADHEADETVQEALVFSGVSPASIADTLIFDYTDTPPQYANLSGWTTEVTNNLGRLYSAEIMKPTPVKKLVSELALEAGLTIFSDIINEQIILRVMRQRPTVLAITDDNVLPGTLDYKIDEDKRVNTCYTFFGRRNPLLNLDERQNYRGIAVYYDDDPNRALEDLPLSIREIYSRWITAGNRPAAEYIGQNTTERLSGTPGVARFSVPRLTPARLGSSITIETRLIEDQQGAVAAAQPGMITRAQPTATRINCEALLFNFALETVAERIIIFDENALNVNLRDVHDLIYTAPGTGDTVTVIVSPGVIIGSDSAIIPAFDVGDWPEAPVITMTIEGRIQGLGGVGGSALLQGGEGGPPFVVGFDGGDGGLALYTRYAITIDNQGEIWGGGGGGGANTPPAVGPEYRGGGGQGYLPGSPNATTEAPGTSTTGQPGGGPGSAGTNGTGSAGGAAGGAVDGDSYITYTTVGDIQGSQIN